VKRAPRCDFASLGPAVWSWIAEHLRVPDGPLSGRAFVLNAEQTDLLYRWYEVDAEGLFVHRRGCWRAAQGTGKSPFLAAVALAELAGPTRCDGFDSKGQPIAVAPATAWVQIAAVSEDQSGNVFRAAHAMAVDSDLAGVVLDVGLTRISLLDGHGSGRIEAVTASAATRFGQRATFVVLDETHLWTKGNRGDRLADVLRRSAAKMAGRTFEGTNAHAPGEGSVAEATCKAAEDGAEGLLYAATEAPEIDDLTDFVALRAALAVVYGDAATDRGGWVDLTRLCRDIADPATNPDDARRFFLNQIRSGAAAPVDIAVWEGLGVACEVAEGARVALGFDGSISDDETALYGCTADGHLFLIEAWSRPAGAADWRVPRAEVHAAVAGAFERYDVGLAYFDPPKWYSEVDEWAALYGEDRVVALDTNSARRFAPLCDRFATAVAERAISHDGDVLLTRALAACARKNVRLRDDPDDGRTRFVVVKADTRKIDRAVAAILALGAAEAMPEPEPTGVVQYYNLADL
jgi:hypothetical protein